MYRYYEHSSALFLRIQNSECDGARNELGLFMGKHLCIVHILIHIYRFKCMVSGKKQK